MGGMKREGKKKRARNREREAKEKHACTANLPDGAKIIKKK